MKLITFILALVCLASCILAWDKEDYEIFDLQSAIEAAEGKGTTFYSWLEISPTASSVEIAKAYRKKSLQMHPDKNPGVKGIAERYARLGVVQKILRSENRERYDFFYKNGFPRWRGTGYYYSRFRPGVGTVLVFLTMISAGMQYMVQRMTYSRDVARIEAIIAQARRTAWGPKLIKVDTRRKVKVNLGGREVQYDEDGNEYGVGRSLDMVVEGDKVWLIEAEGELTALDTSVATPASWGRTWPITLARDVLSRCIGTKKTVKADTVGDTDKSDNAETEYSNDKNKLPGNGTANGAGRRQKSARK